jgi:hypothetical protein
MNRHEHKRQQDRSLYQQVKEITAERNQFSPDARAMCREGFEMCIPNLISFGKGEIPDASAASRIRAIDHLGRYGYGKLNLFIPEEELLRILGRISTRHFPDKEDANAFLKDFLLALEEHYQ